MISDIVQFGKNNSNVVLVLAEVKKIAAYRLLNDKDSDTLSLIAEEMIGFVSGALTTVSEYSAKFWIESNVISGTEQTEYLFRVSLNALIDFSAKEELLSITHSGNDFRNGAAGKIKGFFDLFKPVENDNTIPTIYDMGRGAAHFVLTRNSNETEKYDGLEKCILNGFADDILIGVSKSIAKITVKKIISA
jgi:hypothetical protein